MAQGQVGWMDLTVPDAVAVVGFYERVVGWTRQPVSMGDYDDFCVVPSGSEHAVGGVCHARGANADLPPVWMMYITVDDMAAAIAAVEPAGGAVLRGPKPAGGGQFAVIRDPAGAVFALYSAPA